MNPFYRRTGQAQRPIPRPAVKQDIANPKSSSSGMTKERASRRNSLGLWGLVFAKTTERGDGYGSIRAEHELAVAFEIGAGAHVELAVLADEEQGALRHFFGALQKQIQASTQTNFFADPFGQNQPPGLSRPVAAGGGGAFCARRRPRSGGP